MANFPSAEHFENALDDARAKNWDRLLAVREEVLKALEPVRAAKTISANLEARVTLSGDWRSWRTVAEICRAASRVLHRLAGRNSDRRNRRSLARTLASRAFAFAPSVRTAKNASAAGIIQPTSVRTRTIRRSASVASPRSRKLSAIAPAARAARHRERMVVSESR